jgi:ATP-dependent helicase/DNAse subunit B
MLGEGVMPSTTLVRVSDAPLGGLAANETGGYVGLKILTFYQYCQNLLMRLGSFDMVLADAIRPALVARILSQRKAAGKLQALASISEFRGTPLAVLSLIDELERAALSPEQVIMHLQKSLATHSRFVELAELYKDYWHCLDTIKYSDKRRLVFRLLQILSDRQHSTSLGLIAFDGFDRFNPLQLKTMQELSNHCKRLVVSFDYVEPEEDRELNYAWKANSYNQLCTILGDKVIFAPVASHQDTANLQFRQTQTANKQGAKLIDDLPNEIAGKSANKLGGKYAGRLLVEKFVTTDRYFEMTQIAALIKESVVRQNKKPSAFLVVARKLKQYRSAVKLAFEDSGLEYFVDEAIELIALPVVQFVLSMISLWHKDFPRAETITLMRSAFFNPTLQLSGQELEEVDNLSFDHMVVDSRAQWKEALAHASTTKLSHKVDEIFNFLTPSARDFFPDEYVSWVEDLIDKFLKLPDESESSDFAHWEQDSALAQLRRSLAVLIQEHHALNQLGEQPKPSCESLFYKLEKLVDAANFRRKPRSKDYVLVTDADLAPNRIYDEIFIAGMVEGEFPQRISQSGFTTVDEVEAWARFDVDIHNPRFDPNFETALFQSLKQRASSRLVLSCPAIEMSGEELTPSFLLRDDRANTLSEQESPPGSADVPSASQAHAMRPYDPTASDPLEASMSPGSAGFQPASEANDPRLADPSELSYPGSAGILLASRAHAMRPSNSSTSVSQGKLCSVHPMNTLLREPNSFRNAVGAQLWTVKSLEGLSAVPALADFVEALQESLTMAQGRIRNVGSSVLNGYLVDHVAAGSVKVSLPEYWSVSRLSDYGKCPFRYWVSHVAGIELRQEPEAGLNSLVIGQTYHLALELFYKELLAKNLSMKDSADDLLTQIFDKSVADAFNWLGNNREVRKGEFWHYDCQELTFRLKRFFQSERERAMTDDFAPLLIEASFGMGESLSDSRAHTMRPYDPDVSDPSELSALGGAEVPSAPRAHAIRPYDPSVSDTTEPSIISGGADVPSAPEGKDPSVMDLSESSTSPGSAGFQPASGIKKPSISDPSRLPIYPPLSLRNGDSAILIRGRIDRIDKNRVGELRVVDYKSGSTRISKDDALSGRNMQLPLYALAIEKAVFPGAKVVEGQYLSIAQGSSIGKIDFNKLADEDSQITFLESAESSTKQFVNAVKNGDFSVRPSTLGVCQTCDHITVCRISELTTHEEEADDTD